MDHCCDVVLSGILIGVIYGFSVFNVDFKRVCNCILEWRRNRY